MPRTYLQVPDFEYSGDYFPQIAARIRRWGRINAPEITNEDPREPFIQAERAFSMVGHYNNVLLDMVANGSFLRTATLPESVKLHLEQINYNLLPAGPAHVDILCRLAQVFTVSQRLIEAYRRFATARTADVPEIIFENTVALDITPTDVINYAYGVEHDSDGTASLNSLEPDVIYAVAAPFVVGDVNKFIAIEDSILGNNMDDARIIEVYDSGRKARVEKGSFVSEASVTWRMRTVSANGAANLNAAANWNPFFNPQMQAGDKIYVGHNNIMWDRFDVNMAAVVAAGWIGVWEYYDPNDSTVQVDSVTVDGGGAGTLRFGIGSFLGTDQRGGALVKITYVPTGEEWAGYSAWDGVQNIIDIDGYMGQSSPSTSEGDYLVDCNWRPLEDVDDGSLWGVSSLAAAGANNITWTLPQERDANWTKFTVYDSVLGEAVDSYYIRYRIVQSPVLGGPSFVSAGIDQGPQYVMLTLTQGVSVEDSPLGSSNAEANQEFVLSRTPFVLASAHIWVDEGGGDIEWEVRSSFSNSLSTDRHVVVEPQTDGQGIVIFGDGVNGRIPPLGTNNIRASYRISADEDGNVGAGSVTVNRDGVGVFRTITNPRQGKFWIQADWASEDSLEQAKSLGPQFLRTMYRATNGHDAEVLGRTFKNAVGVRPIRRAQSYEEAYGPKTIELVVTGSQGATLNADDRAEVEEYFNGGEVYGYPGVLMANYELVLTNYSPKLIGLDVRVEAYSAITVSLILQSLQALLNPTALATNRIDYIWRFGQSVPLSRIQAEIFAVSPTQIFDVDVTSPTSDIQLTSRELPVLDVVNTNIVIVPPSFA